RRSGGRSLLTVAPPENGRLTKMARHRAFGLRHQEKQACREQQQKPSRHHDRSHLQMRQSLLRLRGLRRLEEVLQLDCKAPKSTEPLRAVNLFESLGRQLVVPWLLDIGQGNLLLRLDEVSFVIVVHRCWSFIQGGTSQAYRPLRDLRSTEPPAGRNRGSAA